MADANSYIIVWEITEKTGEKTQYTLEMEAYSASEAVNQSIYELDGQYGFIARGATVKILMVRPKTDNSFKAIKEFLEKLGLLRMTTMGSKS